MSTRSLIAAKMSDGTIKFVYCHWDGYPAHNGKLLLDFYNTQEKVEALLELGSISSLREKLAPAEGVKHTFDDPAEDVTIAYHRDRNEPWAYTHPYTYENKTLLYQLSDTFDAEYIYLFMDGKWHWTEVSESRDVLPTWPELTQGDCI